MNIVVAGAGKVGRSICEELSAEGHEITMIDCEASVLERIQQQYDVITVEGNSASGATLMDAQIENADVLIAATNTDEVNILSCMTAHTINKDLYTIARIRDPEYIDQAYLMGEELGLRLAVNPEQQAAQEIMRLLKYPGFLHRESFAKARVEIVELKVQKDSLLEGAKLIDLPSSIKCKILVCVVIRDGVVIMPDGNFVLKEDDRIFVTGTPDQLHLMLKNLGMITTPVKHVLIAGGSRLGYYLAEELDRNNISSTIIDQDPDTCERLAKALPNSTIILGDVSKQELLLAEDMEDYDAFVSLTGMDELNIVTSMYAHIAKVPLIVTKLGRGGNFQLTDKLPIGSIVCPKELTTMHIVRYIRAMQNQKGAATSIHRIANNSADAIEFVVDEHTKHVGEKLKNLKTKQNVLIVSIVGGTSVEIPSGESSFEIGDTIVVVTNKDNVLFTLNDIFEE